jgi:hypothetical protein
VFSLARYYEKYQDGAALRDRPIGGIIVLVRK